MSVVELVFKGFQTDPEGASLLVDEAVSNWMVDELERHEPWLQSALAVQMAEVTAVAKRQLARSYVETMAGGTYPDDECQTTAQWLAGFDAFAKAVLEQNQGVVAKARRDEEWHRGGAVVHRQVNRDAAGRFARYLDVGTSSTVTGVGHVSQVSPHLLASGLVTRVGNAPGLGGAAVGNEGVQAKMNLHQAQWEQASRYASELADAYPGPSNGVVVQAQILGPNGEQRTIDTPLRTARAKGLQLVGLNPLDDTILSVVVTTADGAPSDAQDAVHRFNTVGAVGDTALARLTGPSAENWAAALARYDTTSDKSRLTQLFGNLKGGGEVLQAIPGGEKAGHFAALVGSLGPDAERVLGPHIRQAAYRYRGTEKTPDAELAGAYRSEEMARLRTIADNPTLVDREGTAHAASVDDAVERALGGGNGRQTPIVGSAKYRSLQGIEGDQLRLRVNADVAAAHLTSTLPTDPITAQLSERAGHVLPSQGVMLDAEGRLLSQAVGYADDHYLPFDLKNMGRLRGGQYVRTRVQGGLSGEDVYAAVQTGARMATVVSSSGVYSLELDPAFRGARANSDKARAMYGRYLQILDAVEGSDLYLQDLPPAVKDRVREQARLLNSDLKGKDLADAEKEALNAARRDAMQLGEDDRTRLEAEARDAAGREVRGGSAQELARRQADIYEELKAEALKDRVVPLALNGEGYRVALETLQRQFPYFIRGVSYEPLASKGGQAGFFDRRRLDTSLVAARSRTEASDRGYVRPGGLRPAGVRGGYYNPSGPEVAPKTRKGETEPAAAPGGAAEAAGGEGTAAGAAKPPAATGRTDISNLPLQKKLAALSVQEANRVRTESKVLSDALATLPKGPHGGEGKSWEQVKDGNNVLKVQALLEQSPEAFAAAVKDQGALEALNDKASVKQAFNSVYGAGLNDEMAAWPESQRKAFGGAENADQLADWFADQAQRISDAASLTKPFNDPFADPAASAFYAGERPQGFPDLLKLDTPDAYKAFTQAGGGKDLKATADALFPMSGGRYPSAAATQAGAAAAIDVLNRVKEALPKVASLGVEGYTPANLARLSGASPAELEAALGGPADMTQVRQENITARAEQIQRAWTLRQVERSLQALHGGPEGGPGDVHPKAGQGLFAKASWSRRARVLDWEDPRVLPVLLAKAAGRL